TAALLSLLPLSVDGQSTTKPTKALLPLKASTLDDSVPEQRIEQLAQIYRTHVYHAFRTDRERYDQRRDAWHQTLAAWIAAGKPADQRDVLNNWLEQATIAVRQSPPGPIPPLPVFGDKATTKTIEQIPKPMETTPANKPPVQQPVAQKPASEKPSPKKPTDAKPPVEKQQDTKNPVVQKPAEQKLDPQKMIVQQLIVQKLIVQQPIVQQSAAPQPVAPQPVAPQPVAPQPVAPQPVAPQPVAPQPIAQQPVVQKPASPGIKPPTNAATSPRTSQYTTRTQPRHQYQQTLKPEPVQSQTPTSRQATRTPNLPSAGNTTPPIPSQARSPNRIAPRVTPPQRTTYPRLSVPSSRHIASRTKPTSPQTTTDPRSWRSSWRLPQRTKTPHTTAIQPSSNSQKPSGDQASDIPVLPGLDTKNFTSVKKADTTSKPQVTSTPKVTPKTDTANKVPIVSLGPIDDIKGEGEDAEVNLIELAARIAGTNMALRGIEAQLKESHRWDVRQLTPMVNSLKQICDRRNDLTLFRKLLDENDRGLVGELDSPHDAISKCSERIAEVRAQIESHTSLIRSKHRQEELGKLDALSRELAKLVSSS
ncbi:MAG: histone H1-like repetitive region-containing protein, partial [Pirellulales bacterium]|nr:histone H1-like repetitive region-containing protein [Pirellulales bacterium]